MEPDLELARRFLAANPPRGEVLMCAITGSHQYGFPSVDSDIDLKGLHVAPTEELLGLSRPNDAHDRLEVFEGVECDLTTHEIGKGLSLLLKGNGNILERLTSPYQLIDSPALHDLRGLLPAALSRRCHGHYAGYLKGMRREHARLGRAKTLLYAYRVALTGRFLLDTGRVEAHLPTLADHYDVEGIDDLIDAKRGAEKGTIPEALTALHEPVLDGLARALYEARDASPLPSEPPDARAVESWLVSLRRRRLDTP